MNAALDGLAVTNAFLDAYQALHPELNTAATLWCSAAIGTLAAYGMYDAAIIGAIGVIAGHDRSGEQ